MPMYKVKQGDCIESIAYAHGIFWEIVWNHPKNKQLKQTREDPNLLFPGDSVFVPEKRKKQVKVATGKRHIFKLKGVPSKVRLRFLREQKPRASAKLTLGEGDDQKIIPIQLGSLDPLRKASGIQARLNCLGYKCGKVDGELGDATKFALLAFQQEHGLSETGEADDATLAKLQELFGC